MPVISVEYECRSQWCPVCETRYGRVAVDVDAVHLHHRYKLCSACVRDKAVIARIEAVEHRFRKMPVLPSWWRRRWLSTIEHSAVQVIRSERRGAREQAAKTGARSDFLRE